MKLATPPAPSPLRSAKTGARDQNVPLAMPETSAPTTPTGEMRKRQASRNCGTGGRSGRCRRRLGRVGAGLREWQHGQRERAGDDRERHVGRRVDEADDLLPGRAAGIMDDLIDRQHAAAHHVLGLVVHPAFDRRIEASGISVLDSPWPAIRMKTAVSSAETWA